MALSWDSWRRRGQREPHRERYQSKMTYSTDEARIVPAVAQGLEKPIPGVDLKITAMAFGAEHLLIVCRDKGDERRGNRGERGDHQNNSN